MSLDRTALKGTSLEYINTPPRLQPWLNVDVFGPEQSGKTKFALSAPGPILHQLFGNTNEVERAIQLTLEETPGKEILLAKYLSDVPPEISRSEWDKVKKAFQAQRQRVIADMKASKAAGIRSGIWDKGNEVWETVRYEHFGRLTKVPSHLYGPANTEFADIVKLMDGLNFVLIHEDEEEWEDYKDDDGKSKRRTTGRRVRKGNEKVGYLVDVVLRTFKVPPVVVNGEVKKEVQYMYEIVESRHQKSLIGQVHEGLTFPQLAMMVKPEVNPEAWF